MKTKLSRRVSDYQIVDHGIEHSQYFQGCGVAFSDFQYVVTGCGDNFAEAIDDALDQMAMSEGGDLIDFDELERIMLKFEELKEWPKEPSVSTSQHDTADPEDSCELYYYVSIRYSLKTA